MGGTKLGISFSDFYKIKNKGQEPDTGKLTCKIYHSQRILSTICATKGGIHIAYNFDCGTEAAMAG